MHLGYSIELVWKNDEKVWKSQEKKFKKKAGTLSLRRVRLVRIPRLKTKTTQTTKMCEYQIGTGSDGNLIRMLKAMLQNTKIDNLKKSTGKK